VRARALRVPWPGKPASGLAKGRVSQSSEASAEIIRLVRTLLVPCRGS
jgi:hypothetical protein